MTGFTAKGSSGFSRVSVARFVGHSWSREPQTLRNRAITPCAQPRTDNIGSGHQVNSAESRLKMGVLAAAFARSRFVTTGVRDTLLYIARCNGRGRERYSQLVNTLVEGALCWPPLRTRAPVRSQARVTVQRDHYTIPQGQTPLQAHRC